jgi:uncharacterized membrane protein YeaQ/YmgE (transglycosylase-associated protein family)
MNILLWIVLGAIAGWIADLVMHSDHGLVEDILLGVIGSFVGGYIFGFFGQPGITGFNFYSVIVAAVGAGVVIAIGRLIHR